MDRLWTPWRMPYLKDVAGKEMGKDACVFCLKVDAEDAAEYVLARSEHVFVVLNLYPYNSGHLLVVPYAHVAGPEELAPEELCDLMCTANRAMAVLREAYSPHAFNMGANIGAAAGAGIAAHFHLHIVPRWGGDTNYMTVIAETRVIPDMVEDSYRTLRAIWERRFQA